METTGKVLNLDDRLRRSLGRTGRVIGVSVKVTRDEYGELEAVAKQGNQALGEWAREVLLREARRTNGDAVFTEGIATRMLMLDLLRPLLKQAGVSNETISETMAVVRREKHRTAREVMTQYMRTEEE